MAEAHAAAAFSFSVTQEGLDVQISHEALRAVYFSGVRSWRKRFTRFWNRVLNGVFPVKYTSLLAFYGIVLLLSFLNYDITCGFNDKVHPWLFSSRTFITWNLSHLVSSTLLWLMAVLVIRYSLKMLLCYQGWMFEPRGRMSIKTKLWALCTKILGGTNPKLYSYQASLPRMPVPPLKSTIERYLTSVRPLLDDKDYDAMKSLSEEFLSTIASKLQRYLVLKSWWATNYVSDWWEQYVYLAGRGPIMVNSNYYGMDLLYHVPTNIQTSRAANVVHALFAFRSTLDKEMIKPIKVNGVVPLCSSQYERVFNTCRTPGVESGTSATGWTVGTFAVYHQGRWFKMTCYKNGILLEPSELEIQLESIINNTSEPSEGEKHLAALTAGERVPWAKARNTYFADGINKKSLHAIESAFVLILDDQEQIIEDASPGLSSYGRALLHGKCHNRWFDKSFNCVVFKNGRFGINAEHSWADAPIMSYLAEQVLGYEYQSLGYGPDGKVKGRPMVQPILPHRQWQISPECQEVIESSLLVAQNLADDVHLRVSAFKHFGKGLVKTFKMSPDAFIQAALQIAHLRDKGHFSLTYEASMTRLFREGRTETVRSCTNEMCAFARSMNDENATKEERYALLKKAVDRHIDAYKEAMTGQGIDRHLFCLYVVSKYLKLESPFLAKVIELSSITTAYNIIILSYTELRNNPRFMPSGGGFGPVLRLPWRLSTSQTPHQQAMNIDLNKHPNFLSGGGGFGPVADDGYGVSYIICHEDLIMFHVSSKHSSPETDSERFAANIE
uniref:Uncharacterized protein n=1 Tax=Ciona savignyi TaxID=51511 RepID=H2YB10_CIOSA